MHQIVDLRTDLKEDDIIKYALEKYNNTDLSISSILEELLFLAEDKRKMPWEGDL